MKNFKKYVVASAVIACSAFASNAVVAAEAGLYIVPIVGYHHTDDERPMKGGKGYGDAPSYGLGVGYQINPRLAVELQYNYTDTEYDNSNATFDKHDIAFHRLHADALMNIPELNFWRIEPYVVMGAGHQIVSYDFNVPGAKNPKDDGETMLEAGFGYNLRLMKRLSLRTDVRAHYSLDNEYTDASANIGLNWMMWPAAVAAPVVVSPVDGDSDGDGVPDSRDKCPGTSSGAKVDADGCYLELATTKTFTMDVNFGFDSTSLSPASVSEIQELAAFMKEYPMASVLLEGHTDSVGSNKYNQGLSERRAAAVAKALVANFGVDGSKISTVGYGEAKPVAPNATAAGRAQNRRTVGNVQATVEVPAK